MLESRAGSHLQALQTSYEAQRANVETVQRLEDAISGMASLPPGQGAHNRISAYRIIGEIYSSLNGAWIRSFTLQGDRFDFEAEGRDSSETVNAIRQSRLFSGVTLREFVPSTIAGDRFVISGTVNHE
jgi:hypothetical protein